MLLCNTQHYLKVVVKVFAVLVGLLFVHMSLSQSLIKTDLADHMCAYVLKFLSGLQRNQNKTKKTTFSLLTSLVMRPVATIAAAVTCVNQYDV